MGVPKRSGNRSGDSRGPGVLGHLCPPPPVGLLPFGVYLLSSCLPFLAKASWVSPRGSSIPSEAFREAALGHPEAA